MTKYTIRVRNNSNGIEFTESVEAESEVAAQAAFVEKNPRSNWTILGIEQASPRSTSLSPRPAVSSSPPVGHLPARPGCVTAYAVLLGIGSVVMLLTGILLIREVYGAIEGLLYIGIAGLLAALYFLLARGLWLQKNWARVVVIVLQSLGIASGLLSACAAIVSSGPYEPSPLPTICGALVGIGISAYIINWFATNKYYFE